MMVILVNMVVDIKRIIEKNGGLRRRRGSRDLQIINLMIRSMTEQM
jgi:hypothetical protein